MIKEDLAGRPFVGPAGKLFDSSLEEAGIDRARVYVANAVKHFKFVARGKPRPAQQAGRRRDQDLPLVAATRGRAGTDPAAADRGPWRDCSSILFGKVVAIGKLRGEPQQLADGSECWVTVHPSSLLRAPDEEARREGRKLFVADLRKIRDRAAQRPP